MPLERLVNEGPLEAFRVARPEAVGLETCPNMARACGGLVGIVDLEGLVSTNG